MIYIDNKYLEHALGACSVYLVRRNYRLIC